MNRRPNTGPYVVRYADQSGKTYAKERHTWRDACDLMRDLLIENHVNITVSFA